MSDSVVLKEILQELKDVKTSQLRMEETQVQMNVRLGRVEETQEQMNVRLGRMEETQDRMENDITEIKASVKRIEENEPQEVLSLLRIMNRKMDYVAIDVEYLKEKTGKHDVEINRLNKLTQS